MRTVTPGHDLGHPAGATWETLVRSYVNEYGGWAAFADEFVNRLSTLPDTPTDIQTVEKGLRRLSIRGSKDGGQYGRWLLKHFGIPTDITRWVAWLGQYHSRFADLPTSLNLEQLKLWDRPPLSDSPASAWIHVGLSSVFHRMGEIDGCEDRLRRARKVAPRAGAAVQMEILLFDARIRTDRGDRETSHQFFDEVEELLKDKNVSESDRNCYFARLQGQRAYHLIHPVGDERPDYLAALDLFESIPDRTGIPFVDFRRTEGIAECAFYLGDRDRGVRLAKEAAEHAADGGFVRLRILALKLLSKMSEKDERDRLLEKAQRLASLLEDEDLYRRMRFY